MSEELILVQHLIHEIRGEKVMLDSDLAKLYGVETRTLKQAVRRNISRFPADFMFELTIEESKALSTRSQIVTLKESGRGLNTKYKPFVFTELGVAMLSSVLHSEVAIQANIRIMRAFVQVREYLIDTSSLSAEVKELKARVDLLENRQEETLSAVNDLSEDVRRDIDSLYIAIGELAAKLEEKKKTPTPRIGFKQ
ncbi:MAG: ORF6N domain-containing protein [Bacteroidales bacterium]|nr:ORF6N domain-containing protein [Bacteroidales bacterium]